MKLGNLQLDENDTENIIKELNADAPELSEKVKDRLIKRLTKNNETDI